MDKTNHTNYTSFALFEVLTAGTKKSGTLLDFSFESSQTPDHKLKS